ncbi:hypothetical protein EV363DRAFT_1443743 [Boletus edulis]|nr:hypothetical protein EV363DRAFT_1443743 [Boletus edulis]
MANWSVAFYDVLAEYQPAYTCNDGDGQARILADCTDAIAHDGTAQEQGVELPKPLDLAIRKEFLPYLDEEESAEELERITDLELDGKGLTASEREEAARPHLFSEEVAEIDDNARDKKNKKAFGARTVVVRDWFNNLPKSRLEEAESAAKKWNKEGAPDKDKKSIYRKKNLRNCTVDYVESVRCTMGVHCVVLLAYEAADGFKSLYIEPEVPGPGQDRNFTISSNDCKTWATQGADLLVDYFKDKDNDSANNRARSEGEDDDKAPKIEVDAVGNPILPATDVVDIKTQQDLVCQIFTKAYRRIAKRQKVHAPWLELSHAATQYLDSDTIPQGFKISDPSKFTKAQLDRLWSHWKARASADMPILWFIKAKQNDLGWSTQIAEEHSRVASKKGKESTYVNVDDDDEVQGEGEGEKDENKEKGTTSSATQAPTSNSPPLQDQSVALENQDPTQEKDISSFTMVAPRSKRPHLSDSSAALEDQSPAAYGKDRIKFLSSLSTDSSYLALVNALMTLPIFNSDHTPSTSPVSKRNLPPWASWCWEKKYLSSDIHAQGSVFEAALDALRTYKFADRNKGTAVVLGLGLLLRECWRSVEAKAGDESIPQFVQESILDARSADSVGAVVMEVLNKLVSSSGNKELDAQGPAVQDMTGRDNEGQEYCKPAEDEGETAKEAKKPRIKRRQVRSPSPVASTSKQPYSQQDNKIPARNDRAQRNWKPTKRVLGLD